MTTPVFTNLDLNGNRVRDASDGVLAKDYVTVDQLTAATPQGYSQDIGDGVATSFNVVHGLGTLDVDVTVRESAPPRNGAIVGWSVVDANTVQVTMFPAPAANAYRVSVIPVP